MCIWAVLKENVGLLLCDKEFYWWVGKQAILLMPTNIREKIN